MIQDGMVSCFFHSSLVQEVYFPAYPFLLRRLRNKSPLSDPNLNKIMHDFKSISWPMERTIASVLVWMKKDVESGLGHEVFTRRWKGSAGYRWISCRVFTTVSHGILRCCTPGARTAIPGAVAALFCVVHKSGLRHRLRRCSSLHSSYLLANTYPACGYLIV